MTVDPWATDGGTGVMVSDASMSRARKRVPDVRRESGRKYVVLGNDRFKDTYPRYEVTWPEGTCSCWSLNHGDSRKRTGCTHVLAVKLYREAIQAGELVPGANSTAESAVTLPPSGDVDSVDGSGSRVPTGVVSAFDSGLLPDLSFDTVPSVNDSRFTQWDTLPLPPKFEAIHPEQWRAVCEVGELYDRGVEVAFVDAPTGSGKSFIAELIRRVIKQPAFYVCHNKSLQQQFVTDFSYSRVLQGRSNYPTQVGGSDVTCADCTKTGPDDDCLWCIDPMTCAYQLAKNEAIRAKLAVLNTSYFLTESNYVGNVTKARELGIIDECDTLESNLMGFVEFAVSERMLSRVGLRAPKDGSHKATIGRWLIDEFKPALHAYMGTIRGHDLRAVRDRMTAARMMADVLRIASQVEHDDGLAGWVRDNKAGPMVLKPVVVGEYGDRYVWQHAKRWLCMSATIISADELSQSTGVVGGTGEGENGRRWGLVTVPMTFPVENRRIIVCPVADMSRKGKEAGEWEHAAKAIARIINRHPGERVLVHTVSYDLSRFLMGHRECRSLDRPLLTYNSAGERDAVLARFKRTTGAVLFAASMDRGVDLAGDDCRVVIVAKVPFPYLGDRQVSERLHLPGGQSWYNVQTVRKIVQMTGRAVRSKDDWAVSYITDRQFTKNVWGKNKNLLPSWWRAAVDTSFNVRELMR